MTASAKPAWGGQVEVETNPLGRGQVELSIRVPAEPVGQVRQQVLSAFARRANIPGFRRGKAPRSVIERYVDQDALNEQVIDSLLSDAYEAALDRAGIKPLDRGRISDQKLAEDGAFVFKATVTVRPEITLGEYRGLQVIRRVTPVTEAQVDAELERLRSRHAQYRDLPEGAGIEKGDLVVVDYEMYLEGEKSEEGSATGYPLEVGADQLFPELNEALPGSRPGETRELDVNYPADHANPAFAGKTVHFRVTVTQARRRQLPELDDEFARGISNLETMQALRDRVRQNLEAIGRAIVEEDVRDQLVRLVTASASLDVPQILVDRETDRRIDEVTEELERRNLSLHQHLRQMGRSFEDWRADLEADARQVARRALVMDEIGEREQIKVEEEEIHAEIGRMAEVEDTDEERVRQRLRDSGELTHLINRVYHRKILQFLVDHAQVTEEIAEPESVQADRASESSDQSQPSSAS